MRMVASRATKKMELMRAEYSGLAVSEVSIQLDVIVGREER